MSTMSSTEEKSTPCDSNDYQLSLYSDLLDDDEFALAILPCSNTTNSGEGEESSSGVVSEVVPTVASRTTVAAVSEESLTTSSTEASSTTTTTTSKEEAVESAGTSGVDYTNTSASDRAPDTVESGSEEVQTDEGSTETETQESSNESTDNSDEGDSDKTTEQETSAETSNEPTTEIETTKFTDSTFYTCHPNPSSLRSGEFAPDDVAANKFEIAYDYELLTPLAGEENSIEELENAMANDLAAQFGLIDCTSRKRGLRNNKKSGNNDVVAISSDPADQVMEGKCELNSCALMLMSCLIVAFGNAIFLSTSHATLLQNLQPVQHPLNQILCAHQLEDT